MSDSLSIEGIVTHILPLQTGEGATGKTWTRQEIVIRTLDAEYPKSVCIALKKEAPYLKVGERIMCDINVESREYSGKWYTNVTAWRFATTNPNAQPQASEASAPVAFPETVTNMDLSPNQADLPF